jgi:hypothetical protein
MRTKLIAVLSVLMGWSLLSGAERAQATTMTATLCDINVAPLGCPGADTLDFGVRTNFVGLLGPNRWAVLPFAFADATAGITGNIFVVDIAGRWIYLFGQGIAGANTGALAAPVFLNVAITQNYITAPQLGAFIGIDTGFCNGAATGAGSGQAGFPFVNGTLLAAGGGNTTACSPFAQNFGPNLIAEGRVTNMTAIASFDFENGVNGQLITLPWGDDWPDLALLPLNADLASDVPAITIEKDLTQAGLTQQVPEPITLSLFGAGVAGVGMMRRRRKTNVAYLTRRDATN